MTPEDKKKFIIGAAVTAVLLLGAVLILKLDGDENSSKRYVVLSEIPGTPEIQKDDPVIIGERIVGFVVKATPTGNGKSVAVRMSVEKEAFETIGENTVAWVGNTVEGETAVIIEPGAKTPDRGFVKIKAVKGINSRRP